jgi:dCMP deaminase
MKTKYQQLYMDWAHRAAELSHARRLKVGAVIVKDDVVIYGYNGMPAGWDNNCEEHPKIVNKQTYAIEEDTTRLVTRPEVLHAESNAIAKLAKSPNVGNGADLFVTHSPCIHCAKLIFQSGIRRVFYGANYRDDAGVQFLRSSGITVTQIEE